MVHQGRIRVTKVTTSGWRCTPAALPTLAVLALLVDA